MSVQSDHSAVPDKNLPDKSDQPSAAGGDAGGAVSRLHPERICGAALSRSLRYTTTAWLFGAFWMTATNGATRTRLAMYLGVDDFLFGVLAAVAFIGVFLQIPGSLLTEWLGRRKGMFIWWLTLQRSCFFLLAVLPWILPAHQRSTAWIMVLMLLFAACAANFGGPAWTSWMSDLVPARIRGKFFARRSRVGIVVMAFSGLGLGLLLDFADTDRLQQMFRGISDRVNMPPLILIISVIFFIAAIAGVMDIQSFRKVDEPPMRPVSREAILVRLSRPVRDSQFMRYCAYYSSWTFSVAFAQVFWWVYLFYFFDQQTQAGRHAWWLDYKYVTAYLCIQVAYNIGQFLGYPVWGRIIDRFGCKPVIYLSSMMHSAAWLLWPFLGPQTVLWLIPTQIYGGVMGSGQEIANFNVMLGFNRKGGPGYQAIGSVLFATAGAVASIAAGKFCDVLLRTHTTWTIFAGTEWQWTFNRYALVVIVAISLKMLSDMVVLPLVHDVEARPTRHAMRFLITNMYGNLNTVIFTPMRQMPQNAMYTLGQVGGHVRRFGERMLNGDEDE